jgi:hypothetical protein
MDLRRGERKPLHEALHSVAANIDLDEIWPDLQRLVTKDMEVCKLTLGEADTRPFLASISELAESDAVSKLVRPNLTLDERIELSVVYVLSTLFAHDECHTH